MRLNISRNLLPAMRGSINLIRSIQANRYMFAQAKFSLPLVPILFFYANFYIGVDRSILNKFDWYIFNTEMEIYRTALSNYSLPGFLTYKVPNATALSNIGEYYPAFPYGIRTPDVFILPFVSNLSFIYIHLFWVVCLGLYGIFKLANKIQIGYFAYLILSISWFLSGPLVARMGIGHTPLFGYFLIPLFFYLLLNLNSQKIDWKNSVNMGLFLFLIGLLGSAIVLAQMCLRIVFNMFMNLKKFMNYITAICIGLVLSSYVILPAIFHSNYIGASNRTVFEGYGWNYPNSSVLKNSIINYAFTIESISNIARLLFHHLIRVFEQLVLAVSSSTAVLKDGGWEWTLYSGVIYLPIIFLLLLFKRNLLTPIFSDSRENYLIKGLCLLLFILSVSLFYRFIHKVLNLVIEFPAIDRVPYRMMIYVLFLTYLYLFKNFELIINLISKLQIRILLQTSVVIAQYISLFLNGRYWALANLDKTFQKNDPRMNTNENVFTGVANVPGVTIDTYIGYGISIILFILLIGGRYFHMIRKNPSAVIKKSFR